VVAGGAELWGGRISGWCISGGRITLAHLVCVTRGLVRLAENTHTQIEGEGGVTCARVLAWRCSTREGVYTEMRSLVAGESAPVSTPFTSMMSAR
jgi:hypothetical protein